MPKFDLSMIDELIHSTDRLLNKIKDDFTQPKRNFYFMDFLCNKPVAFDSIRNLYRPTKNDINMARKVGTTLVIHGHSPVELCYANHFCHEYTYVPGELDHPSFKKQFNLKWAYLYG